MNGRSRLEQRLSAPSFRRGVDRATAKLDAEDAGWAVMEPRRARALLAVARAAKRSRRGEFLSDRIPGCLALDRALGRLEGLSDVIFTDPRLDPKSANEGVSTDIPGEKRRRKSAKGGRARTPR